MMRCQFLRSFVKLPFLAVLVAIALFCGALLVSAQDETVEGDTSAREIWIESDFSGADLVIFGAVGNSRQQISSEGYYDVVIVVRGPPETVVTWRKKRIAGIWVNFQSQTFEKVPSFYGVLSTRKLEDIAGHDALSRFGIEFNPKPEWAAPSARRDVFEEALIRIKQRDGMYVTSPYSVIFLGESLFRGVIKLPVQIDEGNYTAQIFLFRDGKLLAWDKTYVEIGKAGVERYLYNLAYGRPWFYGLLAVLVAIGSGFLGWTLFSRN